VERIVKTYITALSLIAGCALTARAQVAVETQDGLELVLAADGRVVELRLDERTLPLLEQPGGFFVEDLMRSIPLTRFEGSAKMKDEGVVFRGRAPDLALELEATFTPQADHVRGDGRVRDTSGADRGLRVGFHLPLDARGWTWWDDIAASRPIAAGQTYAYYGSGWSVGPDRQVSVYPFASVTGEGAALSLA